VEFNSLSLQPSSVTNILTLRYDPSIIPNLARKTSNDFKPSSEKPSIEFIENTISKTIRKQLDISSVKKICIALSGGIDSTLILTLIKKTIPDLHVDAISIKFANSIDETQNASKIAAQLDTNHHVVYVENYLEELPKAISIMKFPIWGIHWYHVVKKSQSLSKHLVSGDGGDELFGGYTFRYKKFLSLIDAKSTPLEKVKAYLLCHERDHVPDQEKVFGTKAKFSWSNIHKTLISYFDNTLSPIEQVFLADYNGKLLYNFNPLNERISNHFGIQSVSPLLSEEMISYSLSIPTGSKYDKAKDDGKLALRKLLSKYNMDKFIPSEKLGFNVDPINLWQSSGKDLCQEYLTDSQAVKDGWINKDWISKYICKDDLDVRYVNKFLGLLAFEVWYRLFITKDMSVNTTLN
jgi:asparagine synthase (glutamine-hydrolysing)|tara:strand:- start:1830 stop:3050 length:1221 start_codon:yes stop_codon:yes gene_type:complete